MIYMGNEEFWDEKFSNRKNNPLKPEAVLTDNIDFLKPGNVLDVACGDGRNSLYLSTKGFNVTGIDFSAEGLKRLDKFSRDFDLDISTKQVDLSNTDALDNLGVYDNIIVCHYRLQKDIISLLKDHVTKDGILFVTGFYQNHVCDDRIKEEDLLYDEDFVALDDCFNLLDKLEEKDERGSFVTYIYKRK